MQVSYLPEPEKHPLWPGIRDLLEPSAEYGQIPALSEGELVWIAIEDGTVFAAATTVMWDDWEAELRLAGGTRHRDWVGLLDKAVSGWAKSAGSSVLTMRGRKGWARYARALGWGALGTDEDGIVTYRKDLSDGAA